MIVGRWWIVISLFWCGCARTPQLELRYPSAQVDRFADAPVVVCGVVQAVEFVGPEVSLTDRQGERWDHWQLMRARATVENVLRGQVPGDTISFYYYLYRGGVTGNWNSLDEGRRYLFLLDRERGVLRAAIDHWRTGWAIQSGRHADPPQDQSVAETFALWRLTPGSEVNERHFAQSLREASATGQWYLGRVRTLRLLHELTEHESALVRQHARLTLLDHFRDGYLH